jgi:glycosyltransferase involved in cell wall biosynthesis
MMEVFSCNAPFMEGGLGKHLGLLVEEARSREKLGCYYTVRPKPNDPKGNEISLSRFRRLFQLPPLSYSLGWREYLSSELFDRAVSQKLGTAETFIGFSGRALHSFECARLLKYEQLVVESPTSHIDNVLRQHRKATETFRIERSWLNRPLRKKTLREYELTDFIYVNSEYSRMSFTEAGVPESKLRLRPLRVESRFVPPLRSLHSGRFTVVYVGRLHVTKGLPILLEAFRHVQDKHAELVLVGGHGSDGMEKYLRHSIANDPRVKVRPGDPLPYLHRADVLVHPSYEDGFGLAPLEALACGVPVIITEDTGMKEHVINGQNGYILPTGNIDALVEQLREMRSRPLKGTFEPFTQYEVKIAATQPTH